MSDDMTPLTDTRDMIYVHDVFRRAFADAPDQIASVNDGDVEHAQRAVSYLRDVLWLLHAHRSGEDELLYPLLVERAPVCADLFSRMEAQHAAVAASLALADQAAERFENSSSTDDGAALIAACRSVLDEVSSHLEQEELEVLPIAARTITPEEWGALPGHVLSHYTGTRIWLLLGLVFEAMPDDLRAHVLANVPAPVSEMWFLFGADAFSNEMGAIRAGASTLLLASGSA